MRNTAVASLALICLAASAFASDTRTLSATVPAADLAAVALESSIGDIEIEAIEGATEVSIEVVLTPRRGGLFTSKRRAEEAVQQASLSSLVTDGRLELFVAPKADEDRRFEENWRLVLPADLAIEIEHGVGDIVIRNTESSVVVEAGVGDIGLAARGGDITVELGVGTAVVTAPAAAYASAEGTGGVGDVRLTVGGERVEGGGFVGESASWKGSGAARLEVSVGVGDAVIRLD